MFYIFFLFGLLIVLAYPLMLIVAFVVKKKAQNVRDMADDVLHHKSEDNAEINQIIDKLNWLKAQRIVPFLEEDQVRIDRLRGLRK